MATSQNTRTIAALLPGSLAIDGRSTKQLLAQTVPLAGLFNYFDHQNRADGHWDAFFEQIPLVRYARFSAIDIDTLTRELKAWLRTIPTTFLPQDEAQVAAARSVLDRLLPLLHRVHRDYDFYSCLPDEAAFADDLRRAIEIVLTKNVETLLGCRRWLDTQLEALGHPRRAPSDSQDGFPGENLPGGDDQGTLFSPAEGESEAQAFSRLLIQTAWATQAVLSQLVDAASQRFDQHIQHPRSLPPHFALYLAFLRQFAGAQATLNDLPRRHRDFFYRTVLGQVPSNGTPDTLYVTFQAASPSTRLALARGTRLLAGQDPAGQPIIYATTAPFTLTSSDVGRIATVELIDSWTSGATGFYAAPLANSTDGLGAPLSPGRSWASFGEDQSALSGNTGRTMPDAQIGFAISSPVLHLEEGERTVDLQFDFFNSFTGPPPVPEPILAIPFQITYSAAAAWTIVPKERIQATLAYALDPKGAPVALSMHLRFTLQPGDPGWVNFNPKVLTGGFDSRTPVARLLYPNPLAAFCGADRAVKPEVASAFAAARLSRVTIGVKAKGLQNLVLYGGGSRIILGKPASPFGTPVRPQAAFLIGKLEMGRKRIDSLTVDLQWNGLPTDELLYPNGLSSYYEDYIDALANPPPEMFRNDRYGVQFGCLQGGQWAPFATKTYYLFSWKGEDATPPRLSGPLLPTTEWVMADGAVLNPQPDYALAGDLEFTPTSTAGFLRMTLIAPDYVFGQELYPQVVTTVALENGRALIASAQSTKPKGAPPADLSSAFSLLSVPVQPTFLGRVAEALHFKHTPEYTLNPRVFDLLAKIGTLPEFVATPAQELGLTAIKVLAAIDSLKGATFTDKVALQQLIGAKLGLAPSDPKVSAFSAQVVYWLASLLQPEPLPVLAGIAPMPRLPLSPLMSGLSLTYTASTVIDLVGDASPAPDWDQLWQIHPLVTCVPPRNPAGIELIPRLEPGGYLYLGLRNVQPPESISLLIVVQDQPAPAFQIMPKDPPVWSYLAGDSWNSDLGRSAVHDRTFGFLKTGLLRIDLPPTVDSDHTIMPASFFWIRAHVKQPSAHLRVIQIYPQSTVANWMAPAGATFDSLTAHFSAPLPPGSITGPELPDPQIKQVVQVLASFGGVGPESDAQFVTRVSERLRHKGRAVTRWDYERLMLAEFPEIFYAKVVPPTSAKEAGGLTVVVLPTLNAPPAVVPPGFVPGDLVKFQRFIATVAPISASITVSNPEYDVIRISVAVAFVTDQSTVHYLALLNADLKAFISPWIYRQAEVRDPETTFYVSELGGFIRGRPYVRMALRCLAFRPSEPERLLDRIAPRKPTALLLSADEHEIQLIAHD